jgi:hypothetical protein
VKCDQVGVRELVNGSKLALEPRQPGRIGASQGLEGDELVSFVVVRFVDHAHPSGPQTAADVEAFPGIELRVGSGPRHRSPS